MSYTWNPINLVLSWDFFLLVFSRFGQLLYTVVFFSSSSFRCFAVSLVEQEIPDEEKRWTDNKEYFYLYSRRHIPTTFFFLFSNTVPPDYVNIVWNFFLSFSSLWRVKFLQHYTLFIDFSCLYIPCVVCTHSLGPSQSLAHRCCTRSVKNGKQSISLRFIDLFSPFLALQMGAQTVSIMGYVYSESQPFFQPALQPCRSSHRERKSVLITPAPSPRLRLWCFGGGAI